MTGQQAPFTPAQIAEMIGNVADQIVGCEALDPLDRNNAIGRLREVAAFMIGAETLPQFKRAMTVPGSLPNTPPRT